MCVVVVGGGLNRSGWGGAEYAILQPSAAWRQSTFEQQSDVCMTGHVVTRAVKEAYHLFRYLGRITNMSASFA